jgi:UDP-glucuronate 4-epimerase
MRSILVTGGAGFIGSHLVDHLLSEGDWQVSAIDDFNDFYDPAIKLANVGRHEKSPNYRLFETDIRDKKALTGIFDEHTFACIVHLAARAGVRPSLKQPLLYAETNINGTINLLDLARQHVIKQVVFG